LGGISASISRGTWSADKELYLLHFGSDARDFAEFLRDKLLSIGSGGISWHRAYKIKLVFYVEVCNTTK
jgi:hypothetical protein